MENAVENLTMSYNVVKL